MANATATERIEIGGGVTLATATAADFAELNANMREADRRECRVFGAEGEDAANWERAWAVRADGALVGIAGWGAFRGESHLSRRRLLLFMSTGAVWGIRRTFVRHSRPVMLAVLSRLPPWVDEVYSLPMSDYAASVRWQERVLGFERVCEIEANGVRHTLMAKRKGVQV
nr:MAG TPA: hypothetical protein [Caudoviricetes sp.]